MTMNKLKDSWQSLMSLVSTQIILLKFTEGDYNEDWDEGKKLYDEYPLPARIKYEMSQREFEELGEAMLLDAILIIRQKDLDEQTLDITSKDHFKISDKEYRITKFQLVVIASEKLGFKIGIKEIL